MSVTVNSTTALTAALKMARPGETILLAPGTYAVQAFSLQLSGVTVTSADPAREAVVTSVGVSGTKGLTLTGLELRAAADRAFQIRGSSDIHLRDLNVHGSLDGNPQNDFPGIVIQDSSNISVEGSQFQQLYYGVVHTNVQGLTIVGNAFHDMRMDGVRGGGSSYVTIKGNSFTSFYPVTGDHPDAIQFWTTNTTANAHDIVIADNKITRGAGQIFQGVFFGDEVAGIYYEHVKIAGNLVSGGAYHGVTLESGRDITVDGNIVQGFSDQKSWIALARVQGGALTNNQASQYNLAASNTGLVQSGNTVIPLATDRGAAVIAAWDAAHSGVGAPAPVPAPTSPAPTAGLSLVGTTLADTLTGGAGADTLDGGAGLDRLVGGAGDDVYILTGGDVVVEMAGGGVDAVKIASSYTLPSQVENLELTGDRGSTAIGNELGNTIKGDIGPNKLSGMAGADTLGGGRGPDTLVGGAGADRFVFHPGDGGDVVSDFGYAGEHDILDLSALYAAGMTPTLTQTASGVTINYPYGAIVVTGAHLADLHPTTGGYIF